MKRILFLGYTDFSERMKASSLQHELKKQGYDCYIIEQPCYALDIGEIVLHPEIEVTTNLPDIKLPEPFILFCGMGGEVLDTALTICRGNTRAVLTPSNAKMNPYTLSKHLLEEKKAMNHE